MRQGQDEDFHDVIAERYEKKSTIITSNLHFDEWYAAFQNKLLGAATLDRIKHGAYCVTLEGKSYRSPREKQHKPSEKRRKESAKFSGAVMAIAAATSP